MTPRKPRMSRIPQALTLVDFLSKHPNATLVEIQEALDKKHAHASMAVNIIAYVRNKVGAEVLVCEYDESRSAYGYRLALDAGEAYAYVTRRKVKVRNEVANLVGILDRTEAKFPGDPDVRIARAMLEGVVGIMDAGMKT